MKGSDSRVGEWYLANEVKCRRGLGWRNGGKYEKASEMDGKKCNGNASAIKIRRTSLSLGFNSVTFDVCLINYEPL